MMDSKSLETATLKCLKAHDPKYSGAKIRTFTPITGGYSRLTYKIDLVYGDSSADLILQYLPKGATGLVRVDRKIENDVLKFLSHQNGIDTPKMLASDVDAAFFDSATFIFEAEKGQTFIEVCRQADQSKYSDLNKVVARAGAAVHSQDIDDLPPSLPRPSNWDEYLDEQIEFFRRTESQSLTSRPFLRHMAQWLDDNRPPPAPLSLVHGDFQVSNMIQATNKTDSVLVDWELSHIGDPREDLGWFTMVCGAIPPNILEADVEGFYEEYRAKTGLSRDVINPATTAYFLIISSIQTHMGMMKSSDALAESAEQSQSVLAAYYMNITTYQHMNWMNAIKVVEDAK